jgi:hypothetical protein
MSMTGPRDPEAIQREIEETRAELARTVDLIADRLSPRRAASRGASRVKAGIEGVFSTTTTEVEDPVEVAGDHQSRIRSVPLDRSGEVHVVRTLRKDRVAIAVAAAVAVVGVVVLLRRRR